MKGNSDIKETETDPGKCRKNSKNSAVDFPVISYNFDAFSTQKTSPEIQFQLGPYPIDCSTCNMFCPLCGVFVKDTDQFLIWQHINYPKGFIAHQLCLQKEDWEPKNQLDRKLFLDDTEKAKLVPFRVQKQEKCIALGGRQFYMELQIIHPLSNFCFLKLASKTVSIGKTAHWELTNKENSNCYLPNIICLPVSDFKLTVTLTDISTKVSTLFSCTTSLGRVKPGESREIMAYTDQLKLQLRIIDQMEEKEEIIDQMNYKYRYPLKLPLPIVQLLKLDITLPQDSFDEDQQEEYLNDTIMESLNERTPNTSTKKSSINNTSHYNSDIISERSYDKEKVDLDRLVLNGELSTFVRNNTQSRIFQSFLNEATQEQVDQIILALYIQLPDLITHEYANYMVQKLFSVCNWDQRVNIMQQLYEDIPKIVRNKQGTHTIQHLIALFISDKEYQLMCQAVRINFFELSAHPNATHFIQKLISNFPIKFTLEFFEIACKNFVAFSVDKNGMCVLKHMMRKIKQIISIDSPSRNQVIEVKRHFINSATFNIDKIIQDSYGNYIIQFCYQLFGEEKCTGITEMIIKRFPQFSMQKFSSAVVFKCITTYWRDKNIADRLKVSLSNDVIIDMYRNRDSNKILIEIMEQFEGNALCHRLQSQLASCEVTKFNHDRWKRVFGPRTGDVGGYSSFTEAVKSQKNNQYQKQSKPKRKHYNMH